MKTYTVFAVYEDTYQPYATSVQAEDAEGAIDAALLQAFKDNGLDAYLDLNGFQVVEGEVEVIA